MKCVLLCAPGEVLEGKQELEELGFDVIPYPTSQEVELLEDSRYDEFTSFLGSHPQYCDKPYVRSLRISFVKMILDTQFEDDDFIVFGESDAAPVIRADKLIKMIQNEYAKYPDADLFRLFHEFATSPSSPPVNAEDFSFEDYVTNFTTRDIPYVWGTHALVIPRAKRSKIAEIFLNFRLPIDTALEVASSKSLLKIKVARHNWFYQKPREFFYDPKALFSYRKRKIALCLSSYKRFDDLQRQIFSFMNQSYSDFHLFVAVKGISEFALNKILLPTFQEFIDEGKLTIRWFPNKNQISNLIDTIRGLDVSEYELFAKIDDDDFYGKNYLKVINDYYTFIPQHQSVYYEGLNVVRYGHDGFSSFVVESFKVFGASMIFSSTVMEKILKCERNPEIIEEISARWNEGRGHSSFGFSEDNLYILIMKEEGASNIAPFIKKKGIFPYIIVNKTNTSVTRGGFLNNGFVNENRLISSDNSTHEMVIELMHDEWNDAFLIQGKRGKRVSVQDAADILLYDKEKIVLKWDNWGEETFSKQGTGAFELIECKPED